MSIVVCEDLTWIVTVHGQCANSCPIFAYIPPILSVEGFQYIIKLVSTSQVCLGHADAHFVSFVVSKQGCLRSKNQKDINATIDTHGVTYNGVFSDKTVRYSKCELLAQK